LPIIFKHQFADPFTRGKGGLTKQFLPLVVINPSPQAEEFKQKRIEIIEKQRDSCPVWAQLALLEERLKPQSKKAMEMETETMDEETGSLMDEAMEDLERRSQLLADLKWRDALDILLSKRQISV
jgi:hypothetical protein